MKKILLVALAAAAMVSCSQNEEIDNAAQKAEIKFGTAVSTTTRAEVTDLAKLKEAAVGFTVYAYNSGTSDMADVAAGTDMKSFINGAKATYASDWTLAGGPYYWPLTDKIQFFAYGNPGNATLVYGAPDASNKLPIITYTVADVNGQADFVVASVLNADKEKNATSGISLGFTHALTQINFTIKTADAYTYKLKSLSISGVKNKGTYKFGASTSDWAAQEGSVTYSHTIAADGLEITNGTTTGTSIDAAWMVMPQDFIATGSAINLSYDVYDNGAKIGEVSADPIDLKGTTAWGQGKKMRYTLTLANEGAEITLSVPEVGAWGSDVSVAKP